MSGLRPDPVISIVPTSSLGMFTQRTLTDEMCNWANAWRPQWVNVWVRIYAKQECSGEGNLMRFCRPLVAGFIQYSSSRWQRCLEKVWHFQHCPVLMIRHKPCICSSLYTDRYSTGRVGCLSFAHRIQPRAKFREKGKWLALLRSAVLVNQSSPTCVFTPGIRLSIDN